MKSIVYILIMLICSILISAVPNSTSNQKKVIEIHSAVDNPDPALLDESCRIIRNRLSDYGLQNVDVSVDPNRSSINISVSDKTDTDAILPLLTSKGEIEFYETYDRADVVKLLEEGDKLYSLLNIVPGNATAAILGYCKPGLKSQVDSWLAQHYVSKPGEGIKFAWSKGPNRNGDYCLYLLKHNAALDKDEILEASAGKADDSYELMITFNENGTLKWQDLSRNNINKSIAMVIDNLVYFAPVLKDEIKSGKCSVSGNFTLEDVTLLKSLINNGELPLDLIIVK
jgi:SecD/SecF fusion protein